ncbi:transposase family protein [Streptomyces sp. B1I3]|uniref:transposase family protein n=1 Tax=Streptomyces sp. B1I3 TaxID=3042264 RepID=UPI0027875082|nr:transposase family protein [Streptomyces sp. B1I3]MDQ0792416.1 acetyl esterase/lipase [Streptomyces sp. B1I3]
MRGRPLRRADFTTAGVAAVCGQPGPNHRSVFTDRIIVTLVVLRLQLPHAALVVLYGVDRSTITRAVHEIRPLLAARGFAVPGRLDLRVRGTDRRPGRKLGYGPLNAPRPQLFKRLAVPPGSDLARSLRACRRPDGPAPALVAEPAHDPVTGHGHRYAERLQEAGTPTRPAAYPGAVHVSSACRAGASGRSSAGGGFESLLLSFTASADVLGRRRRPVRKGVAPTAPGNSRGAQFGGAKEQ